MKQATINHIRKLLTLLCLFALSGNTAFGYDVWLGLPYFPKGADTTLKSQWELTAPMLDGLNPNLASAKTPVAERPTTAEWKKTIGLMTKAKNNAMAPLPRTHFNYGTNTSKGTLAQLLVKTFKNEVTYGYKIRWVMPFDNQPNEDRTLPVETWSDENLQDLRDWLDNNGHASTRIITNVRNNGAGPRAYVQKSIIEGYSIEARATLWFENNGRRQDFIKWALSENTVKNKHVKFQMPFGRHSAGYGFPAMNEYQAMRVCMRWLVADVMEGNNDFIRRDDVTFLSIIYDPGVHFPEKSADGTKYVNSVTSVLLSIMEQKSLFDGTAPGGLISIAQCMSYDRITVPTPQQGPQHGLVAHWPLDGVAGDTTVPDASGFGPDGVLDKGPVDPADPLNPGPTWGTDPVRGAYGVFNGKGRIDTKFKYALSSSDKFTWTWWAKKDAASNAGSIMVGNRYGGTGAESLEFIKFSTGGAQFANTGSSTSIRRYNYSYTDSAWRHYAMVKNGSSYQLYINGVPTPSSPLPDPAIDYNETTPIPLFIGGDDDGNTIKPNEHFKGGIDDVVLYRSALTPLDVANVMNGNYNQTITMVVLNTAVDSTNGATWSDEAPAHGYANYIIPAGGNLRGETGTTTFRGTSLTVRAGGKFQVRAIDGSDETTTVGNLILSGGAGFVAGQFAELAAGTGTNVTNLLDGTITQSGATRLVTYGGATARSLKIASRISGSGTLQLVGKQAIINNEDNTFSGKWEVETGATLTFNGAGSVGAADIEVRNGGKLDIQGHWDKSARLTVADTSSTSVDIGNFSWSVSNLVFGSSSVAGGTYTAAALNTLGANPVFTGSGIVRVMPEGSTFQSISRNMAGTTHWVCPEGVTSIQVECWGGGGAGGSSSSTGAAQVYVAGGGGAGGTYAKRSIVPVTPGNTYTLTIPPAAVALNPANALTGNRVHGADVSFTGDNGVTVLAKGGQGGQCVINPTSTQGGISGVGSSAGSISDGPGYVYEGGDGYLPPTKGGSGGGGAGSSEDGGDGYLADPDDDDSASLPGVGGYEGGGEGGIGAVSVEDGGNGSSPGGGGGGARIGRLTESSGADLQKTGGDGGSGRIVISYLVLPGSNTRQEDWRMLHFGITESSGTAADGYDADSDGESNLLEFATGQDPHAGTTATTSLTSVGAEIVFAYRRNLDAVTDGIQFVVEWSNTLLPESWSNAGVIDVTDLENPGNSGMENRIATIPAGPDGMRFVHLRVTR